MSKEQETNPVVEAEKKEENAAAETAVEEKEAAAQADGSESGQVADVEAEAATESQAEVESIEATEADADEAAAEAPTLEEQLAAARQEAAENMDRWQRTAAEFANFKRRQEEQRKLQRDRIKAEVLEGVISALDDMVIAFQHVPDELDGQLVGWVEGFRLVQRKLDKILDDQNVMPISIEGKFDPNLHEAVSYEANDDHEDGDIIEELRRGYQIGNRVIRPALVRVAQ